MNRTSAPAGPQLPAAPRKPDCSGAATYASLRTATEWHRALFREPPPRQYDDDYDDDEVAV
jgi:hypothetical protein